MKKQKKPAIRDRHTRVLIDTIAAYTVGSNGIKVHLRSGEKLNLSWDSTSGCGKARDTLDEHFNILGN
jgi:hypothetical protein